MKLIMIGILILLAAIAAKGNCKLKNVVAVIDTGIDSTHPDLKNSLWINPGESGQDAWGKDKSTNGIDDDQNGFIDDVHGWNFVDNNNNLMDTIGHGTHVSGIIAAKGNHIKSQAPNAQLMVLKYFDYSLSSPVKATVNAINYAIDQGVCVINYSSAGMDSSSAEYEALLRALKNNVVFVTASGNSGTNIDKNKFFPARYDLENIISVMSLTDGNHMVASSNFGLNSVTVAAPGENIISTLPVGKYGKLTGTSQAAAFVAGLVVRILSGSRSDLDFRTIKKLLIVDSVEMTHLSQLVGSKGRVNLDRLSADDFMDLGRTASGRLYNK